jgi:hypothetical protein
LFFYTKLSCIAICDITDTAISQMNFTLLLLTVVGFAGTLNFFPKAFSKRPVVVLGALFVIGLIVSWLCGNIRLSGRSGSLTVQAVS